jgi:hypothetical protein
MLKFILQCLTLSHDIIKFVKYTGCYLNVSIAYRCLLTVYVPVASMKINFSKLKLIKPT